MMEMGNVFSRTTWVTSFSRPENKYRPPHRTPSLSLCRLGQSAPHLSHISHSSPCKHLREKSFLSILSVLVKSLCVLCICKRVHLHMHVNVLAVVVCVDYWNRSLCYRPALSPVRLSLGWYICTVDISQHQHLAPGFSYDFSSCRSFVLPLVTLRPMIHTHKEGLKSHTHKKKPSLKTDRFIKKSNIPSCNDQFFGYSGPLALNRFVPLNH